MLLGKAPQNLEMSMWEARPAWRRRRLQDDRRSEIGSHIKMGFSEETNKPIRAGSNLLAVDIPWRRSLHQPQSRLVDICLGSLVS